MCCLPSSRNVSGGLDSPPIWEYQRVLRHRLADELAVLISQRDSRPEQVGALRAAPKIDSMTARAIRFVETFPADQHVLRRELAGELREPAPAAAATLAAWLASSPLARVGAAAGRRLGRGLCGGRLGRRRRSSTLSEHHASHGAARKNDSGDQASLCSHRGHRILLRKLRETRTGRAPMVIRNERAFFAPDDAHYNHVPASSGSSSRHVIIERHSERR